MDAKDIVAIAEALKGMLPQQPTTSPAAVSAVAIKLPAFWNTRPEKAEVWFRQVEAQFQTRTPPITADDTRFNYVVAALDSATAGEVEKLIMFPPSTGSRWPEAIPMSNALTETCAKALLRNWIPRFGIPDDLTSDRGPQFTSQLWGTLNSLLGISASTTTAYHPQANGMVERFHRQLKASLKARLIGASWMDELPLVLLGIRTAWREEPDCSAAELVYGTALHVPGEFLSDQNSRTATPSSEFLSHLQDTMRSVLPPATRYHGSPPTHTPHDLGATGFVYVRRDATRGPLQRPYTGPFRIIRSNDKFFTLDYNGRENNVSVDRLKVAYKETHIPTNGTTPMTAAAPVTPPMTTGAPRTPPPTCTPEPTRVTRHGRHVRLPPRFR